MYIYIYNILGLEERFTLSS